MPVESEPKNCTSANAKPASGMERATAKHFAAVEVRRMPRIIARNIASNRATLFRYSVCELVIAGQPLADGSQLTDHSFRELVVEHEIKRAPE